MKQKLHVSNDEVVRLTFQLAEQVDQNSILEFKVKEYVTLKEENARLSLTLVQLANDKADLQSKLMMNEHDLESAKTSIFELSHSVENYKRDIEDLRRGISIRPIMENISLY